MAKPIALVHAHVSMSLAHSQPGTSDTPGSDEGRHRECVGSNDAVTQNVWGSGFNVALLRKLLSVDRSFREEKMRQFCHHYKTERTHFKARTGCAISGFAFDCINSRKYTYQENNKPTTECISLPNQADSFSSQTFIAWISGYGCNFVLYVDVNLCR